MKTNKKQLIIILASIVVFISAYVMYQNQNKQNKITYDSIEVKRGNIQVTVLATGTIQPQNRLEIKSPIAGRVERVLIKEGELVKKGQILAWMSSTERAALLDAARSKGSEELKKWEELYRPTPVISPINGTVILKNVEPGQSFSSTDAIFVLSNRLTVKAQVDETDIARIKVDQKANVILDAYASDKVDALVTSIAYDATLVNNVTTYLVDVTPISAPEYMRSGMTANVYFQVDSKENILVIPSTAIEFENKQAFVLKAINQDKQRIAIEVGITDGKLSEVVSGLNENDKILIPQINFGEDKKSTNPFVPSRNRKGR
jgi:membrane fusion protein, macrolide-specific efflux system